MEDWEKELREKLQKELPHGAYYIGEKPGLQLVTGKGGEIEYRVMLEKAIREFTQKKEE